MAPAHQRFGAADRAGLEIDRRLVEQLELVLVERVAQLGFDRRSLDRRRFHVGAIEADAVAAGVLGVIHRRVGAHDQRLRVLAVFGIERDADAGGQRAARGRR